MKATKAIAMSMLVVSMLVGPTVAAETHDFGIFTMDFVSISSETNPSSTSQGVVDYDYGIGVYEVTNSQWDAFASHTGFAKGTNANWLGASRPVNQVRWIEAAQFVNWLNTSKGYQAAYNINEDGVMSVWDSSVSDNGFRHNDAVYVLPSREEWRKAAYWNSETETFHLYGTPNDQKPTTAQARYNTGGPFVGGTWNVGAGGEEINGTYDMMGNLREWVETPSGSWTVDASRRVYGGHYNDGPDALLLASTAAQTMNHATTSAYDGFRVAVVPEPTTMVVLTVGSVGMLLKRNRK